MKKENVIKLHEFPQEFHDKIAEKIRHCGGSCLWYPGDGWFKPLPEVKDMNKVHFYKNEFRDTKNVYVYEEGDDPIGDWLMKEHGLKLCDEVRIIE